MSRMRTLVSLVFFSLILLPAFPETLITLRWDTQANPGLEGKLLLPGKGGLYEELSPYEFKKSEIISESRWSLKNLPSGRIRFYVVNTEINDEFSDWAGYRWLDMVEVGVETQGTLKKFKPPEGSGALWYVFDILGEDGTLQPTMQIMPRNQAVYGHVTDAATGLPVRNAEVEVYDPESGKLLGRDKSSASGLYLFFLPGGTYTFKVRGRDYIPQEERLPFLGNEFPRRRDFNLSRVLRENQIRVVVSWDYYPGNLDIFWVTAGGESDALLWEYRGRQPFSSESLLMENTAGMILPDGQLIVEPNPAALSAYSLGYSQARLRVYRGDQTLLSLAVPVSPGSRWIGINISEGEITPVNILKELP